MEWRSIPGFDGYSISPDGLVRRERMVVPWGNTHGHRLHQRVLMMTNVDGYHVVNLKGPDGKRKPHRVHRLMLMAFVGPPPEGADARHLNGIRDDNRLENLAWGSRKENVDDMARHGTRLLGDELSYSVLTSAKVVELRRLRASGLSWRELSDKTGVSMTTIRGAVNGKSWKHLGDQLAECPTCRGGGLLWIPPRADKPPIDVVCPTCEGPGLVDIKTAQRVSIRAAELQREMSP